jgi:PDZ domain
MRFSRIVIAAAVIGLGSLGVSTARAADQGEKPAPPAPVPPACGMMAPAPQPPAGPCPQMRMMRPGRADWHPRARMERWDGPRRMDGRWRERQSRWRDRDGSCRCMMGSRAWTGERGMRHPMMGPRAIRGERSFSTISFDQWIGVETGTSDRGDLTVTGVVPGGPAEKAGVQANDILTSVNGVSFLADSRPVLASLIDRGFADGKVVTVTALREGKVIPIEVTLQAPHRMAPPTMRRMMPMGQHPQMMQQPRMMQRSPMGGPPPTGR